MIDGLETSDVISIIEVIVTIGFSLFGIITSSYKYIYDNKMMVRCCNRVLAPIIREKLWSSENFNETDWIKIAEEIIKDHIEIVPPYIIYALYNKTPDQFWKVVYESYRLNNDTFSNKLSRTILKFEYVFSVLITVLMCVVGGIFFEYFIDSIYEYGFSCTTIKWLIVFLLSICLIITMVLIMMKTDTIYSMKMSDIENNVNNKLKNKIEGNYYMFDGLKKK